MLKATDRDWIQQQALTFQELQKRGSRWHRSKGLLLYLSGAFGLATVGLLFFRNDMGDFGTTLCLLIAIVFGGYYYFRGKADDDDLKRHMEIERSLEARGLKISHDGKRVSDDGGFAWFDPLSSKSYR